MYTKVICEKMLKKLHIVLHGNYYELWTKLKKKNSKISKVDFNYFNIINMPKFNGKFRQYPYNRFQCKYFNYKLLKNIENVV